MGLMADCIFIDWDHRPAARCVACDKMYCLVKTCTSYKSKKKYERDKWGYIVKKEQTQ